jgi:HSP20 family protein
MRDLEKKERGREYGVSRPWLDFLEPENFFPSEMFRSMKNSLPAVNVSENNKNYNVEVIAPGFKKEDFKINVEDDILNIRAESKQEQTEEGRGTQYSRREYNYNAFTRSFRLPDNVKDDAIVANYEDGILKLTLPKSSEQVRASKEIRIS